MVVCGNVYGSTYKSFSDIFFAQFDSEILYNDTRQNTKLHT